MEEENQGFQYILKQHCMNIWEAPGINAPVFIIFGLLLLLAITLMFFIVPKTTDDEFIRTGHEKMHPYRL